MFPRTPPNTKVSSSSNLYGMPVEVLTDTVRKITGRSNSPLNQSSDQQHTASTSEPSQEEVIAQQNRERAKRAQKRQQNKDNMQMQEAVQQLQEATARLNNIPAPQNSVRLPGIAASTGQSTTIIPTFSGENWNANFEDWLEQYTTKK